ncbi:MAG: tetratricopeptide (TPR) repeat protein [Alteromonadaceae bacterium]
MTEAQKSQFLAEFNALSNTDTKPHLRLFNYLNRHLNSFNYYGETLTAQQTLENNSGNCLSLAILTTAYAQLSNIEVEYGKSSSSPVYMKNDHFEVVSDHVVTKLFDPTFISNKDTLYISKPHLIIDYFPTRNSWRGGTVKYDQFIAMYYRNLAADALQKDKPGMAGWLAAKSLKYAPHDPDSINLMAVIYRHLNQYAKAEVFYRHGLTQTRQNLNLLSNYQMLLTREKRHEDAQALQQKMDEVDDPSPFGWLLQGNQYLAQGKNNLALRYFNKTIEKAHYLPDGYAGAGKVYALTHQTQQAKKHFAMALQRTHDSKTEKLYEAKLAILAVH